MPPPWGSRRCAGRCQSEPSACAAVRRQFRGAAGCQRRLRTEDGAEGGRADGVAREAFGDHRRRDRRRGGGRARGPRGRVGDEGGCGRRARGGDRSGAGRLVRKTRLRKPRASGLRGIHARSLLSQEGPLAEAAAELGIQRGHRRLGAGAAAACGVGHGLPHLFPRGGGLGEPSRSHGDGRRAISCGAHGAIPCRSAARLALACGAMAFHGSRAGPPGGRLQRAPRGPRRPGDADLRLAVGVWAQCRAPVHRGCLPVVSRERVVPVAHALPWPRQEVVAALRGALVEHCGALCLGRDRDPRNGLAQTRSLAHRRFARAGTLSREAAFLRGRPTPPMRFRRA
mmetsp:Transcript_111179/g.321383  ORF Transcript_111179/g.321383 Transcript_111179/m.321383 type:complete len:341 (+) Transcript_111179:120-1142(+)